MKLLFIHANPFPAYTGGIETWLYNITLELCKKRPEITIGFVVPEHNGIPLFDLSHLTKVSWYKTRACPLKRTRLFERWKLCQHFWNMAISALIYLWWTFAAARLICRHRKDTTLFVLQPIPGMLPLLLCSLFRKKFARIVCSVRGRSAIDLRQMGHPLLAGIFKFLEMMVLRFANEVIANGKDTAEYLNEMGINADVLPNGVSFDSFNMPIGDVKYNPELEQIRCWRKHGIRIIMNVGTLSEIKGVSYAIQAIPYICKATSTVFKMVFVGKGSPARYEEQARFIGIDDNVYFAGEQRDIPAFLQEADVALGISGGGGISHSAIEMLAAGRPIVAWNNLTYSQLITNRISGHLVDEWNAQALGQGIAYLLNDSRYAEALAQSAPDEVRKYDWSVIASRFVDIVFPGNNFINGSSNFINSLQ